MQVSAFRQSVLMMIMILKPAYEISNYSKTVYLIFYEKL